ncbi:unnamed protein product [Malus baccata var. baccata]
MLERKCHLTFNTQIDRSVASVDTMKTYFISSVLSGGGSTPLPEASAEDWVNMINGFQKGALSSRLGIPMIYGIDAVHGHNNVYNATIFPHNVGLGATRQVKVSDSICFISKHDKALLYFYTKDEIYHWHLKAALLHRDPELVRRIGSATALEARATGIPYVFAPCIAVAACAKHFVGDGGTSKGINEYNTVVDQQELLSIHMPAYSDAIIKGVSTVMISYSSWNGKKMHANRDLITDYLKGTLQFKVMVPINYKEFINDLINLVKNNVVPMDRIDDAAGRILLVKFTMGLFENPLADFSLVNELGSQDHRDLAREAVRKSVVLLKNGKSGNITDPVIPLPKKVSKILVAGSHADNLGYQCGGWTIAWQGFSGNKYTSGTTILGAIKSAVDSSTEVIYSENPDGNFVKSNNVAYAIVVVGEHPYAETAGDSPNLMMAEPGPSVISNVCESVKCIVVLITGRPIVIEPYISSIDALVAAWLPGSEGQGITDVLFGDHGFSGKLPRTWFRTVDQLPMNVGDSHYDPLFPFGFGLETESVKELVTRSTSAGVVARPCILIVVVALILSL